MERTVMIWGKPYTVYVYQRSKTVWTAMGEYMGETHTAKGTSSSSAAAAWARWAQYKGS